MQENMQKNINFFNFSYTYLLLILCLSLLGDNGMVTAFLGEAIETYI